MSFDLAFVLTAGQSTNIEDTVAWRNSDGTLQYGNYTNYRAVQGPNVLHGLTLTIGTASTPGTVYPVYGVVKINGVTYRTQMPVNVVVGSDAGAPPAAGVPAQPVPPQPSQPPQQGARFPRSAICGIWHSDYGDVTFKCGAYGGEGPVPITGQWNPAPRRYGVIRNGTFDPSTGIVSFDYFAPWANVDGSARLTLDPNLTRLSGTFQQSNGTGSWSMWR